MTTQEKEILKLRLGLAIQMKIDENKLIAKKNKEKGIENNLLVDSLRKLESSSGIPFSTIQEMASGIKNASFTTIAAVIEGLDITLDNFFANYYYKITERNVEDALIARKAIRQKSGKK
jgi:transcriptional regulator with XRE-family HTH domain